MNRTNPLSRGKLQEIYVKKSKVAPHAQASGDGISAADGCRLCGGGHGLRRLCDTCVSEGIEERYDQLLTECFGVIVTPVDCMICDQCIGHLRSTQQFRALVVAAFGKSFSDGSSGSQAGTVESCIEVKAKGNINVRSHDEINKKLRKQVLTLLGKRASSPKKTPRKEDRSSGSQAGTVESCIEVKAKGNINVRSHDEINKKLRKHVLTLLGKRASSPKKTPRKEDRKRFLNTKTETTKTFATCDVCGQRYIVLKSEDMESFVCCRCKLKRSAEKHVACKRCNMVVPAKQLKDHLHTHPKSDLGGKRRLGLPKKPFQVKNTESGTCPRGHKKFPCNQCPKKYTNALNLNEHVKTIHGASVDTNCAVCGKDLKTREQLDKHLKKHIGETLYECFICKNVYYNKNDLENHYLSHKNEIVE